MDLPDFTATPSAAEFTIDTAWAYPEDCNHDLVGMPELDWPRLFGEDGMTRPWVRYESADLAEWCVDTGVSKTCVVAIDKAL